MNYKRECNKVDKAPKENSRNAKIKKSPTDELEADSIKLNRE